MKIETAKMDTEVHGEIETGSFTIKADAFMFDTLFAGLYQDPMTASIREICSNAFDANPNKPFHVQLPSFIDKTFSVRDFGEGMSHEFIMKLYTMAGHSNKRNTNDAVGGYGIGSKSPLAYTNSFNIVSIYNGIRSVYNVYRQEDGLPVISWFVSEETTDPSGVEISFSVNTKDIDIFNEKAKKIFFGFFGKDSYPVVLDNDQKFSISNPLHTFDIKKTFEEKVVGHVFDGTHVSNNHKDRFFIRMGCVLYPVENIIHRKSYYKYSFYKELSKDKIFIIDVNIGDFKITRSRDSLILNEKEEELIESLFNALKYEFNRKIVDEFKECKTIEDILEKGIELDKIYFIKENLHTIIKCIKSNYDFTTPPKIILEENLETKTIVASLTPKHKVKVETKNFSHISLSEIISEIKNIQILVCNSEERIASRAMHFHKTGGVYKNTLFIPNKKQIPKRIWNIFENYFRIYYTEDYDPPKTQTIKSKTYKKGMVQYLNFSYDTGKLGPKKDISEIKAGKFLCVPTKDNYVELKIQGLEGNKITLHTFMSSFSNFLLSAVNDYNIVAVNPNNMKKFPKEVEVKDFNDFVLDMMSSNKDVYTNLNFNVSYREGSLLNTFMHTITNANIEECCKYKTEENQEIISFLEKIQKMKKVYKLPVQVMMKNFPSSEVPEQYDNLRKKYPLFRFFDRMTSEEMKFYLQNVVGETK